MNEIWRSVKDYEGLYEVSNLGRVRNCRTGRVLRLWKDKYGYLLVGLHKDGVRKHCLVHRLVAQAFLPNPNNLPQVNHKDENKENNRVENLEWCDGFYNQTYSNGKTVYMYNLSDSLCGLWSSTNECGRNGFDQASVAACCRGDKTKYKSFKWSYEPPKPPKALSYSIP